MIRFPANDIEELKRALDLALAGKPPFSTLILTAAAAIDLNLAMIGTVAAIRRFGP